jgi:hypothetical protein
MVGFSDWPFQLKRWAPVRRGEKGDGQEEEKTVFHGRLIDGMSRLVVLADEVGDGVTEHEAKQTED